jgi:hypothetical protein
MGILKHLVHLTHRVAHAVTVRREPPDFALRVHKPIAHAIAHAVTVRLWVRWLSLVNLYARSQICQSHGPVVSLTTHGSRVLTTHLTIESIGRGELLPSRIILWLDEATTFSNLPAALRRLQKRGLEVKLCKNYGPHTKYYPYLLSEKVITQPLVTADDDILYPSYWLRNLVEAFRNFSDSVNCYRARIITVKEGEVSPYARWEICTAEEPSFRNLATGVSGVIYPPQLLMGIRAAGNLFEDCCPKADDLWLHVQALRSGYKIKQLGREAIHFAMLPGSQKVCLFAGNVLRHEGNDRQVRSTYTKADVDILLRDSAQVPSPGCNRDMFAGLEIVGGGFDGR